MDRRLARQSDTPSTHRRGRWYFYFYFSPPTWSAGKRGVAASVTT
jgi:hypothetical protein